jgi:hypothetical protein
MKIPVYLGFNNSGCVQSEVRIMFGNNRIPPYGCLQFLDTVDPSVHHRVGIDPRPELAILLLPDKKVRIEHQPVGILNM